MAHVNRSFINLNRQGLQLVIGVLFDLQTEVSDRAHLGNRLSLNNGFLPLISGYAIVVLCELVAFHVSQEVFVVGNNLK